MPEYIDKQAFIDYMMGTSRYFTVKCDIESFPTADVAVPVALLTLPTFSTAFPLFCKIFSLVFCFSSTNITA